MAAMHDRRARGLQGVQDDEGEGADALRKLLGKRFVRSAAKDAPEPAKA
jgi:hypothetical protein